MKASEDHLLSPTTSTSITLVSVRTWMPLFPFTHLKGQFSRRSRSPASRSEPRLHFRVLPPSLSPAPTAAPRLHPRALQPSSGSPAVSVPPTLTFQSNPHLDQVLPALGGGP